MSFLLVPSYLSIYKPNYKTMNTIKVLKGLLTLTIGALFLSNCGVSDTEEQFDDLNARIDESAVAFLADMKAIDARRIKAGQTVILRDASSGEPDSWEWNFSDGSPTLTTQNIETSWNEQVGQIRVILKISRSSDGATDSDTLDLQVGPVEMLSRAVFGFEDQDANFAATDKWFSWTPNDGEVTTSLETTDGANGTSQSIRINATSSYGEFQLRPHESGPEFLVTLESNTSYVFSFYIKGSENFTLSEAAVLNVKNDPPVESWFTPFWSGEAGVPPIEVSTSWTKYSYEFSISDLTASSDEGYADGTADHTGPFFKHFGSISGSELDVWIDEISLKEKEIE